MPTTRIWRFLPVLYFLQAVPVALVQEVALVVYKDLGVPDVLSTRWTALIGLPWALQMLLGPLVELNGAKRRWIFGGQAVIAVGLLVSAFALHLPTFFGISLVTFGLTGFASALCNVATDGFYLLALDKPSQAAFAGVQTTSYRLGRLFCVGLLVWVTGLITKAQGLRPADAWPWTLAFAAGLYGLLALYLRRALPALAEDVSPVSDPHETRANVVRTALVLAGGLSGYFLGNALVRLTAHGLWAALGGDPAGRWKGWMLPATQDLFGLHLPGVAAEVVQAGLCLAALVPIALLLRGGLRGTEMGEAFVSFVRQDRFPAILAFVLFFRFGEAMVAKMSPLFLKASVAEGGMALGNDQLGPLKGFAGVVGIILGGLAGGAFVARAGLRRAIWPMVAIMHAPNALYLWASLARPALPALYVVEFVDQFGYGFGFAGYMVILMRVAQRGRFRTAHYAIGTGMGALCIAVAGIVGGIVKENFGYPGFFLGALLMTIPGILTLFLLPMDDLQASKTPS